MPPRLHFEDFAPGSSRIDGGITVSRDDIVAFARRFDPQPFHMDEAAAKQTFVGRLIASGWHTCALTMRIIADGFILDTASMGSPGIEEVRWLRPVRPGDALRVRATVLDARPSQSRPDRGLVRFRFDVLNQTDETAMVQTNWIMVARRGARRPFNGASRGAETAPGGGSPSRASRLASTLEPASGASPGQAPPDQETGDAATPAFDDLVPGAPCALGAHRFMADDIIEFARRFDPQPFHVDPEAARRSHFGGLVASGWHTAAVWMQCAVRVPERTSKIPLPSSVRNCARSPRPVTRTVPGRRSVVMKRNSASSTLSCRSTPRSAYSVAGAPFVSAAAKKQRVSPSGSPGRLGLPSAAEASTCVA
jgi:acyl dehydratase